MKHLKIQFFKNHWPKILSIFFFAVLFTAYVNSFAVFAPGETLNPDCAPGISGCTISQSGSSQWATSGSDISYIGGKVGIGTATPSATLEVNGILVASNINSVDAPFTTGKGLHSVASKGAKGQGKVTLTNGSANVVGVGSDFLGVDAQYEWGFWVTDSSNNTYWVGFGTITNNTTANIQGTYSDWWTTVVTNGTWAGVTGTYDYYYVQNRATNNYSLATGYGTLSSGYSSLATGYQTISSGYSSTAMGYMTTASGNSSVAMGEYTTASGNVSTAIGQRTTASNYSATAMGVGTTASGFNSTAMGYYTTASGNESTAMGSETTANSYDSFALGRYNVGGGSANSWVGTDPLFEIGNGTNTNAENKANALTVLKNGNIGVGIATPTAILNLKAGTGAAGTAPLKFTTSTGALLSPTEAGAVEFDGTHLYFTATNAGTRYQLDQQAGGGGMIYPGVGIPLSTGSAWGTSITDNSTNWNTAFSQTRQWDGGSTGLVAATGRTSLGLGTAAQSAIGDFATTLVSGTNIKTINGSSILGAGDLTVSGGSGLSSDADFNTKGGTNAGLNFTGVGAQYNTFLGYEAGKGGAVTSTADYNVGIGHQALYSNTTGYMNTGIGEGVLYANTTGFGNAATGYASLPSNTTGSYNSAMGDNSLYSNTAGGSNSALGTSSLWSNTSGNNNSAVGYQSGRYIANGSTPNATSNNSLYLGYNTRAQADGDTNEIVIGYDMTGNGSNTATIGNSSLLRTYLTGINLKASSGAAGTAPLKFTSGTNLGTTEAGAVEYDGTHLYFTATNGGTRYQLDNQSIVGGNAVNITGGAGGQILYQSALDTTSKLANGTAGQVLTSQGTNLAPQWATISAGSLLSDGTLNTKGGTSALASNVSGTDNTTIGYQSLANNNTGSSNTAIGRSALTSNTSGNFNMAGGWSSLQFNTTGSYNVALGVNALSSNKANNRSTAVGYYSMFYADDRTSGRDTYNTAVGYQALKGSVIAVNNTGTENTAIGDSTLLSNTSGLGNVAVGYKALYNNTTGNSNTAIGHSSLDFITTGNDNTALGLYSGTFAQGAVANQTSTTSVYLGKSTQALNNGDSNEIVIGYNVTGNGSNTATIGNSSNLRTYLTGINLKAGSATAGTAPLKFTAGTLLGVTEAGAIEYNGTHLYFTAVDSGSRYQLDQQAPGSLSLTTTGSSGPATLVGSVLNVPQYTAGTGLSSDANYNTKGGTNAGLNLVAGTQYNSFFGYQAGKGGAGITSAVSQNTAIGYSSLFSITTGDGNAAVGANTLSFNTTGRLNVAMGMQALQSNTVGNYNIAIGYAALYSNVANNRSTAIGFSAMMNADSRNTGIDTFNTAVGYEALKGSVINTNNTGQWNTAIGDSALWSNTSGYQNTANGYSSLYSNTTGYNNTSTGIKSLYTNITGYSNTAYGMNALYSNTSGNSNTSNGYESLYSNTTGSGNTASGSSSLNFITTGNYDTAIGISSGKYISGGAIANQTSSNSVYLGYDTKALADGDNNEIVIGASAIGNGSNTTTIGTGNVLYVGGSSITANSKVARFTNASGYCDVTPVTGGVSCSSDINLKKNITTLGDNKEFALQTIPTPITEQTTLEKIMQITPVNYNWNAESNTDAKHIGFIAQEMEQIFPSIVSTDTKGTVDPITGKIIYLKSISYASITPYLVKGIQEMNLKIGDLQDIKTNDPNKITLGSLIRSFLADIGNGIEKIFVKEVDTKNLCVSDDSGAKTCLSKVQLDSLIANAGGSTRNIIVSSDNTLPTPPTPDPILTPDSPPTQPTTQVDLSAYNEVLSKVAVADYTTTSWEAYQVIALANSMTDQNTQAQIDKAVSDILAAQGSLEKVSQE